jgi:N-acetylmuramoyl-L-alanine amidase
VIAKKARRVGVDPHLALAIAWQESGWQHKQVSSAGALGAMQVMPGTGRWMSAYLGRRLNLRDLHDNVSAGVVLIKVLRGQTKLKYTVAGYYHGLAGVRRYGMYKSTKRYVANVLAIKRALGRGWDPV